MAQGHKLKAVKLYKEQMGVSLMEAKAAVEAMEREESMPSRGTADAKVDPSVAEKISYAAVERL
jgi:ribosomal protein L7/L12